jgi:hypothetical protein
LACIQDPWDTIALKGLNEATRALIASSVSKETKGKRKKMVAEFANSLKGRSKFSYSDILNYLTSRFEKSGNNFRDVRSAISTTIRMNTGVEITKNILMQRQARAVSILKPKMPKYEDMWDLEILLQQISRGFWANKTNIRARTKANVLVKISIAGRNSDVAHIHRKSMIWDPEFVKLRFYKWKTQAIEKKTLSRWIVIRKLPSKFRHICAYRALRDYMKLHEEHYKSIKTEGIWLHHSGSNQVKREALASNTRSLMTEAGIDTAMYSSGSLRHATITYWRDLGIPLEVVMDRTGHLSVPLVLKYYDCSQAQLDIFKELATQQDPEGRICEGKDS